jgi:hypothetical protein
MLYYTTESAFNHELNVEEHAAIVRTNDFLDYELGHAALLFDRHRNAIVGMNWYVEPHLRGKAIGTSVLRALMINFQDELASAAYVETLVGNERTLAVLGKIAIIYGLSFSIYTTHDAKPHHMIPCGEAQDRLWRARYARVLLEDDYNEELDRDDQLFVRIFIPDEVREKWVEFEPGYFVERPPNGCVTNCVR